MKNIILFFTLIFSIFFETDSCAAARKPQRTYQKVTLTEDISSYEQLCHEAINKVRQEHGLTPLIWWPELSDCAREHSRNMADKKYPVGHEGFHNRFDSMRKIARVYSFGENVAFCYNYPDPIKISVEGWMESEGHRENILSDFEESGIGVAISAEGKFYITQLFANRR